MSGKLLQKLLEEVDHKKAKLDSFRPLPGELIKELNQWFKVELTYSSNALEGNTLTKAETNLIIEKDLPIEGKSLREHLETVGHAAAVEYIFDLAKCTQCDLTLPDILNIHKLIFDRIEKEHAGINRQEELPISPLQAHFRPQIKFGATMNKFVDWLCQAKGHPILIATEAHFKILHLQPFAKGNGITARLLMNLLLLQKGYEPAIIWPENRDEYFSLLKNALKTNNLETLFEFITQQVIDSFDLYLSKVKKAI